MRSWAFLILAVATISMVSVIFRVLSTLVMLALMSRSVAMLAGRLRLERARELLERGVQGGLEVVGEDLLVRDPLAHFRVNALHEGEELVAVAQDGLDRKVVEVAVG